MRRLDIEDILGYVPAPDVELGQYLIEILFQVGPTKGEMPLCEGDLEPWERRRGIELAPWQADLLVDLSRAYMAESHAARDWGAIPAWPKARNMWKYVCDQKNGAGLRASLKENIKEQPRDGSGKRRRNPPPG